jgi:ATP-dependent helicase/nuclease subunit A
MASINFTKEQAQAIYLSDTNILVSAGAGSGKTAVLSERVIEKVKQGFPLESLVVLTFTNAAAKEMHLRIRKKLLALKDNPYAEKALKSIEASNIQTFDSFALSILKRYGYDLNISPNATIMDPVSAKLLKKSLIDSIFNHYYETQDEAFLNYVKPFVHKNDDHLKEQIITYHQALSMHTNFHALLDDLSLDFFNEETFETLFNKLTNQVNMYQVSLKETLSHLTMGVTHIAAVDYANLLYESYRDMFDEHHFDQLVMNHANLSLPSSSATTRALNKDEATHDKTLIDQAKKTAGKIMEKLAPYLAKSKSDHLDDFIKSGAHIPIVRTLILALDDALITAQKEKEMFEFSVVARLAYHVIDQHPSIRETIKKSIHEIMIDEYQDTSFMQESFIALITNNNLYQVGDIKQSIYRFRHAEPKLFTSKYLEYSRGLNGTKIDLNQNFRSREAVLNAINHVFKPIMDESIGGVLYDDNQALKFGNKTYLSHQTPFTKLGLEIHELNPSFDLKTSPFSQDEMEIFHIAKDILKTVKEGFVYDDELKALRKATYQDITILVSVSTRFEQIKQILEYHQIPVSTNRSEPFIDYYDMDLYRHLFKLIHGLKDETYYEKHFKHSVLSVLRSYAFNFDDDLLVTVIKQLPTHLSAFKVDGLDARVNALFKTLIELANQSQQSSLDSLWQTMIKTFDLYEKSVHLDNTERVILRMNHLSQMIQNLSNDGASLKYLVEYFDGILEEGFDIEFEPRGMHESNAVTLMTIHKSKGLEFPIVYLPHLNHAFNRNNQSRFDIDLTMGFLMPFDDDGLTESVFYHLKNDIDLKEDLSERLRVLYVALTRAKERIVIPIMPNEETPSVQYDHRDIMLEGDRLMQIKSYHDIFLLLKESLNRYINAFSYGVSDLTKAYQLSKQDMHYESTFSFTKTYRTIEQEETSQLETSFSAKISELLSPEALENVAFGHLMHSYFELIDFKHDPFDQIASLNIPSDHQGLLTKFFNQPLLKSLTILDAYKEFPFALEDDDQTMSGYIDLLLETNDRFIIIDYKLKTIDKEAYDQQLKGYASILSALSDKKVEAYLYSIIDARFKKIL